MKDGGVGQWFTTGIAMPDRRDGWVSEKATPCTLRLAYPGGAPWGAAYIVSGGVVETKYQQPLDLPGYSRLGIRMQGANMPRVRIALQFMRENPQNIDVQAIYFER